MNKWINQRNMKCTEIIKRCERERAAVHIICRAAAALRSSLIVGTTRVHTVYYFLFLTLTQTHIHESICFRYAK